MAKEAKHAEHKPSRFFDELEPRLDSFGLVLVLTLISLGLLLLVDIGVGREYGWYSVLTGLVSLVVGLTLLASLRAAGAALKLRRFVRLLIIVGLAVTFLAVMSELLWPDSTMNFVRMSGIGPVWAVIALITPVASTRRLLRHRRVRITTLYAAISAYLQIAIACALVYINLAANAPGGFFATVESSTVYMYYSLTTIATLGYGDFVSVTTIGRAVSMFEAVLGQIYLVVVVAMLVGLYVSSHEQKA